MYQILLCLRYLKTRYIALASIISVMLGVATMIVVNSVMAGFSSEMRERIHGILADVVVETHSLDGVEDAEEQMARIRSVAGEHIEAMTATVEVYGMLSFQYRGHWITRPVTLIGIDPASKAKVGPLIEYLDSYNAQETDGQVTRAALRDAAVTPGWELTPEALEYRVEWKQHEQWINERRMQMSPEGSQSDETENIEEPQFEEPPDFTAEAPQFAPESANPSASVQLTAHEEPAAAATARPAADSPDGGSPDAAQPESESGGHSYDPFATSNADADADFDPTAPLAARIYIGHGLISYMEEDSQTGKNQVQMMVRAGDDVKISTVSSGRPPEPRNFNATVVDVLKTGMSEYDSNLVFVNLEYLQNARGMIHPTTGVRSITSVQLKLKDYDEAPEVVRKLQAAFPPGVFSVRTWEQKQGPLLAAVEVESAILNVLLFLIIAVAGFGILAIFYMIVVEKTRDIGILKALGASSGGVMKIFLSYGLALGIVGSGVGVALGLVFVRYINVIEGWITWVTGRKVFDEKIYYFPEIPTSVQPSMVLWVALGAMLIAVMASVLPARRASRLHPVESLRYE